MQSQGGLAQTWRFCPDPEKQDRYQETAKTCERANGRNHREIFIRLHGIEKLDGACNKNDDAKQTLEFILEDTPVDDEKQDADSNSGYQRCGLPVPDVGKQGI